MKRTIFAIFALELIGSAIAFAATPGNNDSVPLAPSTPLTPLDASSSLVLRYDTPAVEWMTEALPIGNGYMGAMFFGTPMLDRIQFTEESLWEGGPGTTPDYRGGNRADAHTFLNPVRELLRQGKTAEAYAMANEHLTGQILVRGEEPNAPSFGDYGAQQTFGDLIVATIPPTSSAETPSKSKTTYTNYSRELDISKAVGTVRYTEADIEYETEYFASYPTRMVVARYSNNSPDGVGYQVKMITPHTHSTTKRVNETTLELRGNLAMNKLGFEAVVRIKSDGKFDRSASARDKIAVSGASYIEIYLTAATQYKNSYPTYRGNDPREANHRVLEPLAKNDYQTIRTQHINDYQTLFNRTTLNLGTSGQPTLTIPERQKQYATGAYDPALETLYFQWGRYLLISSSRPGSMPANLQGKWNNSTNPAWACDYHMNINQQMIYWHAPLTGLPEVNQPLIEYIMSLREPGAVTARDYFGARGWSVGTMNNPFGYTAPGWDFNWGYAPNAASWLAQHVWEQYAFYPNEEYLRRTAYPIMKDLAHFWFDYLTEDKDGTLVSSPSYSPEHGEISIGATMDQEVAWDLFTNILEANKIIRDEPAFIDSVRMVRDRLSPLKVGRYGQLQEWKEDLDDPQNDHRHVSHMFALHPGRQISPVATPELARAARRTLIYRGDDGTGWSLAWKINFWARLLDGNHAYNMARRVIRPSGSVGVEMSSGGGSYSNLLCAHPPFQIDGNMGYVSGVVEMLLQSHNGTIDLLPALPTAWPTGSVKGIHARGGYAVDIDWKDGKLTRAVITPMIDATATVRYNGAAKEIRFDKNIPKTITF